MTIKNKPVSTGAW